VAPELTGEASRAADSGVVVGLSEPEREGWLVRNGVITILAPGTHEVAPRGVNDAGVVVGTIGTDPDGRAFLYDGSMSDLQPALADIDNHGRIVGMAIAIDPVTGESVPNPATGATQPTPVLLTVD
jgi:probable HAF family extracellular repeat protein